MGLLRRVVEDGLRRRGAGTELCLGVLGGSGSGDGGGGDGGHGDSSTVPLSQQPSSSNRVWKRGKRTGIDIDCLLVTLVGFVRFFSIEESRLDGVSGGDYVCRK